MRSCVAWFGLMMLLGINVLAQPLKTPELYTQCAQPLKDVTSTNAALADLKDSAAKKRIAAAHTLAQSCDARTRASLSLKASII
ncbi:MAG: hypothetical protein HOP19_14710, partial [Acidobacteria bacterium]|nr:hypothetical protein [Acidobacteriota bacterium]